MRDNGPGIPESEIETVLSSFGQGSLAQKTAEQGAGLREPVGQSVVAAVVAVPVPEVVRAERGEQVAPLVAHAAGDAPAARRLAERVHEQLHARGLRRVHRRAQLAQRHALGARDTPSDHLGEHLLSGSAAAWRRRT